MVRPGARSKALPRLAASATRAPSAARRRAPPPPEAVDPAADASMRARTPPPNSSHRPGRQPAGGQCPEVGLPAPLGVAAEDVVEEPERPEAEQPGQDHGPGDPGPGHVADPGRRRQRPPALDGGHGQGDDDARPRRQEVAPVVGPLEHDRPEQCRPTSARSAARPGTRRRRR